MCRKYAVLLSLKSVVALLIARRYPQIELGSTTAGLSELGRRLTFLAAYRRPYHRIFLSTTHISYQSERLFGFAMQNIAML